MKADFRSIRVNKFLYGRDFIIARRANSADALRELCPLLYQTDPYIYPAWLGGQYGNDAFDTLRKLILTEGSVFARKNLSVVKDYNCDKVVALACLLENTTPLDYDYATEKSSSLEAKQVIEGYIEPIIEQALDSDPGELVMVNFCVNPDYQHHGIGHFFLESLIQEAAKQGYRKLKFDCLKDNTAAIKLYTSCGAQIVSEGKGFALSRPLPDVVDFEIAL